MQVKQLLEASFVEEWTRLNYYNSRDVEQREIQQLIENIEPVIRIDAIDRLINQDINSVDNKIERESYHQKNMRLFGILYAMILFESVLDNAGREYDIRYLNKTSYQIAYTTLLNNIYYLIRIYPCIKPSEY